MEWIWPLVATFPTADGVAVQRRLWPSFLGRVSAKPHGQGKLSPAIGSAVLPQLISKGHLPASKRATASSMLRAVLVRLGDAPSPAYS